MSKSELLPCPFCGSHLDAEDSDTLHRAATSWKMKDGRRHYVSYREESDGHCYTVICNEIYGGCGASITEDSTEEVITAWNKRYNPNSTTKGNYAN